jgi:hypothetical protein
VEVLGARVDAAPGAPLDATRALSACTLDIIGRAGFGYDFGALAAEGNPAAPPNEFGAAFGVMLDSIASAFVINLLEWLFPPLRALVRVPPSLCHARAEGARCSRRTAAARCARRSA